MCTGKGFSIMLKKMLIAAVAVVVGLAVVNHTRVGSLMRLNWHKASAWAQKQVPIETEIDRLQMELAKLDDDKGCFDKVARQEVQAEKLEAEITVCKANLEKHEQLVQMLRKDLEGDSKFVVHSGERYSRSEVMDQLKQDWNAFQRCDEVLKSKQAQLKSLRGIIDANRQKLRTMQENRTVMANELTQLRLAFEQEQVKRARAEALVDDQDYSGLRKSIEAVKERLATEKKASELRGEFTTGRITLEQKRQEKDVLKEIDARFDKNEKNVVEK